MPDVVLPVLNEVEALPWVLSRMPDGYRPLVVDNGSDDGSAETASALGVDVVFEPRRGFGAACAAGLAAASDEVVCFMDADGSFDPVELPKVADPIRLGRSDLVLGARMALQGRLAASRSRCQSGPHGRGAAADVTFPAGSRAHAGRPEAAAGRARHSGSTVWLASRDGPTCSHTGLAGRRGRRHLPPPYRPFEGDRDGPGHPAGNRRHGRATPMTVPARRGGTGLAVQVVVIAKEPRPGAVKTRLCPPLMPEAGRRAGRGRTGRHVRGDRLHRGPVPGHGPRGAARSLGATWL